MPLSLIDTWVADGDVPAVAAAVVGREGVRELRVAGAADERSLFALASLTKPLVALAVLVAAEEGALDLDAPVGEHLAPYRVPGRDRITARHLLSHASGLPESAKGVAPLDVEPVRPPAELRVYSNEGFHVLGALLAAATGIDFRRYVTEAVFDAGGLDAHLPLPDHETARALEVRDPGLSAPGLPLFNAPEWRRRGNAAGGAFATVTAYAEVVRWLLAAGGPLSAESHADLRAVQFPGLEGGLESFPKLHCSDWGLGVNVRGHGSPHWCGDAVSASTLSHFGASGTLMWADLEAGRGLVCLACRGTYSGWMLRPGRWADLTQTVLGTPFRMTGG
jgi:CubicO group peptidase (beta-lactamase class C family)